MKAYTPPHSPNKEITLKFFVLFFLFFNLLANAEENYSFRIAYGQASTNDFGNIISGNLGSHPQDLKVVALDGGYLLKKDFFDLPIDLYVKGGFSYFDEEKNDDTYEALVYVKAIYNIDFLDNRVRFGLGEGVSYTTSILEAELYESDHDGGKTSHFLNYVDVSLDFDLGRLINYEAMRETYVGVLLKHRSGAFGLYNGVKDGGSNYNSVYLERNF